jgi:hypothetical protein
MAYDVELADRVRELTMFGGLAFLLNGNMAVAASSQGGLLLRADPTQTDSLLEPPHVQRFVMRGREMNGWLNIAPDAVRSDDALRRWVGVGVAYASALPVKRAGRRS